MLKSLRLKNFKLHEDTSIEAAPITVFIGPNNSGKSSIFQVLLCLREGVTTGGNQLVQAFQQGAERILDLGEFASVVRLGQMEVQVSLSGGVDPGESQKYRPRAGVSFEVRFKDNYLAYNYGSVTSEHGTVEWGWMSSPQNRPLTGEVNVDGLAMQFGPTQDFRLLAPLGYKGHGETLARQRLAELMELHQYVARVPSLLLRSFHPIFPLRGFEQWGYPLPDKKPEGLDLVTLDRRAVALAGLLAYDRDLEERVSKRLSELVNIRVKVRLIEGKRVTIWAEPSDTNRSDTLFANEGTGANQLPFILVPIALTPPNETILLSEPEAHLHPKAQSELMAVILGIAKKEHIQFLIETHSEHVLHKLLHSVAKGELAKEDLAIYYFEPEQGAAKVRRLEVDDHGGVKGGLPGFFDQSLAELGEYLDALKKK